MPRYLPALIIAVALVACACGHDDPADPGPTTSTGTTDPPYLRPPVVATWTPPQNCQEVAEVRAPLASSTQTDALTELMRRGTEDAARRLHCDEL